MNDLDIEQRLDVTLAALDFKSMISDVKDFLEFSEENIAWQYRRELQSIAHQTNMDNDLQERLDLEQSADHRFRVSLPLRVRYSALLLFVTSVEWSVKYLNENMLEPIETHQDKTNATVKILKTLSDRAGLEYNSLIADYEALVQLRNCIVHAGGIVESYRYKDDLPQAINQIPGATIESRHFFGPQVYFERGALEGPFKRTAELILMLHRDLRNKHHQR